MSALRIVPFPSHGRRRRNESLDHPVPGWSDDRERSLRSLAGRGAPQALRNSNRGNDGDALGAASIWHLAIR